MTQAQAAADAAMASLLDLVPGQTVAVFYSDDDVWHERLLLWRFQDGIWYILTPDQDVYAEDLRCFEEDAPIRIKVKVRDFQYWSRVGGAAYCFSEKVDEVFATLSFKG